MVLSVGLLLALGSGAVRAQSQGERGAYDSALLAEGRGLYRAACAACHGVDGDGAGPLARRLDPRPRDLTAGVFKLRSTPSGELPTDEDLFRTISSGVPGTWMPAWQGLLGERQRWALVEYVKTLSPAFREEPESPAPLPLPASPPAGVTAREGRHVYAALQCWSCHGVSGRGDGPSARTLVDDAGRPIRPYDFTRGDYRSGGRPADLYRTLRTGLSGTPMPAYEPDVVLFAGGSSADVSPYRQALPPEELAELREYLASQPDAEALSSMTEAERETLASRRLWAVVAYLESLERPPSLIYRLFLDDPSATPARRER